MLIGYEDACSVDDITEQGVARPILSPWYCSLYTKRGTSNVTNSAFRTHCHRRRTR
jgi:hypothetical protein